MNDNEMTRWTEEDETFLRENFGKLTYGEIARKLKRSKRSICHKAFNLGLSADAYAQWNQEDLDLLRRNFMSMSSQELAVCLRRSVHAVRRKAHKLGLRRDSWSCSPHSRKAWTQEDEVSLRELAKTMSSTEIAKHMGRSVASILSKCCLLKIRISAGRRQQSELAWPPEKIALLRAGAKEGKSLSLIAEDVGKTVPAVIKALRRLGIKRAQLSQTKPLGRPRESKNKKPWYKPVHPYTIPEGWISRKDAEAIVGVCKSSLYALCRAGKIEGKKVGQGSWIVLRESAERYAEERRAELARKAEERIAVHNAARKTAQTAPKRAKPKLELSDEAQVAGMSKLDILKALAGL